MTALTSHLKLLEAESIHIFREAAAQFRAPVLLYSIGKDSTVLLHIARKAFWPAKPPFPLLHVDTTWKFREMIAFRDRTARELGLDVPLLGGDGWDSPKTAEIGGKAVEGVYITNHYSPDDQRPEVRKFIADYQAKYGGKTPDAMAVLGYDAMNLMADAIRRAGSTDGEKIRAALAETRDFPAVSGHITMDADRNARKDIVIVQMRDGQFRFVESIAPDAT